MTLIIYLRCEDGCILISDRKESDGMGGGKEVKKNYLSKNNDFALAGAGDGLDIDFLISKLNSDDDVTGENVTDKIGEILSKHFEQRYTQAEVSCLLIAWKNNSPEPYEIKIFNARPSIVPVDSDKCCIGIPGAVVLANYLLDKFNYRRLPWRTAVQYVIAVMNEIGKEIDGVGDIERFGLDIVVFHQSGVVYEYSNYRYISANIEIQPKIIRSTPFAKKEIRRGA